MAIRLRGEHDGKPIRLLVADQPSVIGTDDAVELRVRAPTISRRHALLQAIDDELHVRDLDSSNGTRIDGVPITGDACARPGQIVQFGDIRLAVERVSDDDAKVAAEIPAAGRSEPATAMQTLAPVTLDRLAFEHLPDLLRHARDGTERPEFVRRLGEALWDSLPLAALQLAENDGGILFEIGEPASADSASVEFGGVRLTLAFERATDPAHGARIAELAGALLDLIQADSNHRRQPTDDSSTAPDPPPLDPDVQRIYQRARRAADSGIAVLIRGESGTGKELLAHYLHAHSGSQEGPFVAINCAAMSSDLLEAELFGIEKGVATGVDARAGCFERAHGGTLFLDEIGDMPRDTQAKILRVLQEGEVVRVGGSKRIPARPRLISATNRNLEKMLSEEQFRIDLLHRIAGWQVTLPPLRERPADLSNLALHFLARYCSEHGVTVRGISQSALKSLRDYHWPGNVRELQQEMHRVAVFLGDGDVLSDSDLGPAIVRSGRDRSDDETLEARMNRHERMVLKQALADCDGNASKAAGKLGIARSTLYRRMAQLGLGDGNNP